SLGKAGGALMADVGAIGRLISLALRSGIPLREVYRQLRGISSGRVVGLGPNKVLSVPDAIGIAIEKWMQEKQGVQQDLLGGAVAPAPVRATGAEAVVSERTGEGQDFIGACPDCGSQLAFAEGCAKCQVCGFSECGGGAGFTSRTSAPSPAGSPSRRPCSASRGASPPPAPGCRRWCSPPAW